MLFLRFWPGLFVPTFTVYHPELEPTGDFNPLLFCTRNQPLARTQVTTMHMSTAGLLKQYISNEASWNPNFNPHGTSKTTLLGWGDVILSSTPYTIYHPLFFGRYFLIVFVHIVGVTSARLLRLISSGFKAESVMFLTACNMNDSLSLFMIASTIASGNSVKHILKQLSWLGTRNDQLIFSV